MRRTTPTGCFIVIFALLLATMAITATAVMEIQSSFDQTTITCGGNLPINFDPLLVNADLIIEALEIDPATNLATVPETYHVINTISNFAATGRTAADIVWNYPGLIFQLKLTQTGTQTVIQSGIITLEDDYCPDVIYYTAPTQCDEVVKVFTTGGLTLWDARNGDDTTSYTTYQTISAIPFVINAKLPSDARLAFYSGDAAAAVRVVIQTNQFATVCNFEWKCSINGAAPTTTGCAPSTVVTSTEIATFVKTAIQGGSDQFNCGANAITTGCYSNSLSGDVAFCTGSNPYAPLTTTIECGCAVQCDADCTVQKIDAQDITEAVSLQGLFSVIHSFIHFELLFFNILVPNLLSIIVIKFNFSFDGIVSTVNPFRAPSGPIYIDYYYHK